MSTPTCGHDWVALTGGAARGAFQVGALHALVHERGLRPTGFAGVSIGALTAAWLAAGPPETLPARVDRLASLWLDEVPRAPGLRGRERRLRELLDAHLDLEALQSSPTRLVVGAVDVRSGRFVTVDNAAVSHDHLVGATRIPFLDRPVAIGQERWVDGVLRRTFPLDQVIEARPSRLLVLTAGAPGLGPAGWTPARLLSIALDELIMTKEVRATVQLRLAGVLDAEVLAPTEPLASPLRFSADAIRASFEHGRQVALSDGWRWPAGTPPPDRYDAFLA